MTRGVTCGVGSRANMCLEAPLIRQRPFRAPHYTISHAGLVGGAAGRSRQRSAWRTGACILSTSCPNAAGMASKQKHNRWRMGLCSETQDAVGSST
jgi:hypothetical protein